MRASEFVPVCYDTSCANGSIFVVKPIYASPLRNIVPIRWLAEHGEHGEKHSKRCKGLTVPVYGPKHTMCVESPCGYTNAGKLQPVQVTYTVPCCTVRHS